MADQDWTQVRIPMLMAQAIDQFMKTDIAKKNGVFSRTDFVVRKKAAKGSAIGTLSIT